MQTCSERVRMTAAIHLVGWCELMYRAHIMGRSRWGKDLRGGRMAHVMRWMRGSMRLHAVT